MLPKDQLCIFLVRHGQTDWNVEHRVQGIKDINLNKTGKQQAKNAAKKFQKICLNKIYASHLRRA
ncbi:MAG: histidine phosphatase family protein, partial [Nanoarchaeota archaeon]|nr:histidine phosphatase family protein [Nanoarchaeota archaeon]